MRGWGRVTVGAALLGLGLAGLGRLSSERPPPLATAGPRSATPAESPAAPEPAVPAVSFDGSFGELGGSVSADEGLAHFALGRQLLEFGDYYSAASHLAAAREGLGDRPPVCLLLARAYDQLNMTLDLLELMPCLAEASRELPGASALYDRLRRQVDVEEAFQAAASDHFVASFPRTGAAARRIGEVLDLLERVRSRIEATIGLASSRLIPVVLYDGDLFEAAIDKPHWASGLYDGKIRVHIDALGERPERFEVAVAHEYVHALTHEITGRRLPTWLREGLADALARADGSGHDGFTRPFSQRDVLLDLAELSGSFNELSEEEALIAYRQSFWMVRQLADEAGWPALADLVRDLQANPALDFETAFDDVYGESPADYLARFATFARR